MRAVVELMEFSERHPALRRCLRPLANLPGASKRLKLMVRAYMGATSFDIHDVDVEKGRVGIGGVDEIMFGSELVWVLHRVLERLGPKEKDRALYDIGFLTGYYEAKDAIRKGRWAPALFLPLITDGRLLERVREDPLMARFFDAIIRMEARIIINEGGWGNVLEFNYSGTPIRAVLANSQEASWLGPSAGPVCRYFAGGAAGHASAVTGRMFEGVEVECAAAGAENCVFELRPAGGGADEMERRALARELLAAEPSVTIG